MCAKEMQINAFFTTSQLLLPPEPFEETVVCGGGGVYISLAMLRGSKANNGLCMVRGRGREASGC